MLETKSYLYVWAEQLLNNTMLADRHQLPSQRVEHAGYEPNADPVDDDDAINRHT